MNTLFITPEGTVKSIGDMPVELGDGKRKRASSIVPLRVGKRIAFLLLRTVFGERGITAEWTRTWHGPWHVLLYQTGETFTAQSRRVCLDWEHKRLDELLSQ